MNDILFEILKAVLILAVILFTRYAVPWMKQEIESMKYSWVVKWVAVAVCSAEQTIFGDKRGEEKKAIVTQFIKNLLIRKNIALSDAQIDNLIEAAVHTSTLGNSIANKQERRSLRNERDTGWMIVGSEWFGKDNE